MSMAGIPVASEIEAHRATGIHTQNQPSVTPYFRQFWQKQGAVVAGTWVWTANASQTDFASVTGEAAGYWGNSPAANLDEYKWSNIFLTPGTYSLSIISVKGAGEGIMEALFGTTSLGTVDMYSAANVFNFVATYTFTITTPTTADIRVRVNGKNAASTGYGVVSSRLHLEKTA